MEFKKVFKSFVGSSGVGGLENRKLTVLEKIARITLKKKSYLSRSW